MKTFIVVKGETLEKMLDAFANQQEYTDFILGLIEISEEIGFANGFVKRAGDDNLLSGVNLAKILVMFSSFCRSNMEIIQELVRQIEFEIVQEEGK